MPRAARLLALLALPVAALVALVLWTRDAEDAVVPDAPAVDARRAEAEAEADERRQAMERRRAASMARVTGEVRRAGDRGAAADLVVTLTPPSGPDLATRTDARGAFEFRADHGGPYELSVASPGSAEVRVPGIQLARGETKDVGTLWLAPAVAVAVEVRTFAGEPIGGARVEVFRDDAGAQWDPAPVAPVRTLTTAADGVAHLTDLAIGTYTFVASKTGFARRGSSSTPLAAGDAERRVLLALERGCRIAGRVLERDGSAVASATVLALPRTLTADGTTEPLCGRAVSAADGRYVLESLPASDVCVWVARQGGGLGIVAAVRPPGVPELDLVLPAPAFVEGRVTDAATSAPLGAALVTAQFTILGGIGTEFQALAADDGSYRLELPMDGSLTDVEATAPGFLRASDPFLSRRNAAVRGGTVVRSDFALHRGASVAGRVTCGGEPVPRAGVHASLAGGDQVTTTDRDGRFRFDAVPAGTATLSANAAGYEPQEERTVEVGGGGSEAVLDLELRRGGASCSVRGIVRRTGGEPLAGVAVSIGGDAGGAATSAADGTFTIAGLRPGESAILVARKAGFAQFEMQVVPRDPAEDEPFEFELTPFRRIAGRVRSGLGAALVDAFVQVASADERSPVDDEWTWLAARRHPVRADGSFQVEVDADVGDCVVRALAADHAPGFSERVAWGDADDLDREVEITLPAAGRLAGVVRTTDGDPVAAAWVAIYPRADGADGAEECNGAWGPAVVAVTDATGRFSVDGLSAGLWGVNASGTGTLQGRAIASVPSGGDVTVEVERSLTIEGSVTFARGEAAPAVTVSAESRDGEEFAAVTDARGAFRFEGLAPGAYRLCVLPQRQGGVNFLAARVEDVAAGSRGVVVELSPGLAVAGVVVSRGGRPLRDVTVEARRPASGEAMETPPGFTDATGAFELVGLPAGDVDLFVEVASDDDDRRGTFRGFAAGERGVRIVLPELTEFRGVLVDESGGALGGMQLVATPSAESQASALELETLAFATADDGTFAFRAPEDARFVLQLVDSDGVGLFEDAVVAPGREPARIVARAGASITGVVTAEGQPVAGATVSASGSNHVRRATTDERGAFEVRGLMRGAPYELSAAGPGLAGGGTVAAEAGARDVKLAATRGHPIAGRIEDESGRPLRSARIGIGRENSTTWIETDDDGRFAAEGFATGEWNVFVWGRNGAMHLCGVVRAGDTNASLRLEPR